MMTVSGKPKLLDEVRSSLRLGQYAWKTEKAYVGWIEKYLRFHRERNGGLWKHPREMGKAEVEDYLSYLAIERNVAASTQNRACVWIVGGKFGIISGAG